MAGLLVLAVALACSVSSVRAVEVAPRLESYLVDKDLISISGFSSGAAFAVQFHVAFSQEIMGAGILVGVPYYCAQDNATMAITTCSRDPEINISIADLVSFTKTAAMSLHIDAPSNLTHDRVYVFQGTKDALVDLGVAKKVVDYYRTFTNGIQAVLGIPAEHSMVTNDYGNQCGVIAPPYIVNCHYSAAYHLLQHIYGNIKPSTSSAVKPENLLEFDQSEFFQGAPAAVSMDTTGYVYVPTTCQNKTTSCIWPSTAVNREECIYLGETYALHAGYNGIAEINDIIIVYPQVINSTVPLNRYGCWDWWGYTTSDYTYGMLFPTDGDCPSWS